MLDAVYDAVSKGDHRVLMIDAPTGTGKTSCISAALAAAPGKIVVAVRTVSQIDIYMNEIADVVNIVTARDSLYGGEAEDLPH
jgi:DNA excision repair protein ERCC-2